MDRVILRTPPVVHRFAQQKGTFLAAAIALLACALYDVQTLLAYLSPTATECPPHITTASAAVAVCITVAVSWKLLHHSFRRTFSSRRFIEAAVEITPIGVQLVSVYGTDLDKPSLKSDGCKKYENVHYKVRSFLPIQQILDVIVMEVVWPHCVWSQVAFRVLNGVENVSRGKPRPRVQELLQKNKISIVPAFPEECRGMLSYEQCLQVQCELEELLGL